jgi:hypothetical protein
MGLNEMPAVAADAFARHFMEDAASDLAGAEAAARTLGEIRRLGLEAHAWELEAQGYTVLPPDKVAPAGFGANVRDVVLACGERRAGRPLDQDGAVLSAVESPFGQVQMESSLLLEDQVFEQVLMNEPTLALITYLLGESCILNHLSAMIKGPGPDHLPLHADQNQSGGPPPFTAYAQVANATWALTDYTPENGSLCLVPSSHKLCRPPTTREATDLSLFQPVTVPAGSVIIWHGNTWHGAFRRTNPGCRVSLVAYFTRGYMPRFDDLSRKISADSLARNPPRFAKLVGAPELQATPEDFSTVASARAARNNLFA